MKRLFCLLLAAMLLLCGCAGATADTDFEPDYPTQSATEPATDEEILAYRRDVVEQAMREQSAVLWSPAKTFTYSRRNNSQGLKADKEETPNDVFTFYAGRIYQGIPYTHGSGSYYSWLSYATSRDENGVYTLTGLTTQHLNGKSSNRVNLCARLGNDCADQLFWAWGRISGSISFRGTASMTEFYGCLKVGDYDYTGTAFSAENNTKQIVKANGEQRMFAAYAQLQKGDGMTLVNTGGEGHAVMVVSTEAVYLDDGTIDGEKSFVTVLEQTSGCERDQKSYYNEQIGAEVYPCEIMDKAWSYNEIFKKGYLPMTCKELVDPSPRPAAQITDYTDAPSLDNMFGGVIQANYRISSITVTITKDGNTVQEATCYGHQEEMYQFNLYRFMDKVEQTVMQGVIDPDALESGNYHCTFTVRLSTGENIPFRDFDFTK